MKPTINLSMSREEALILMESLPDFHMLQNSDEKILNDLKESLAKILGV